MTVPTELGPLARLLEQDSPRLLVVVGAGVSIEETGAPHASWLGLLNHGIDHLVATGVFPDKHGRELRASLEAAFSPFDLPTALQHAELVELNLLTPKPKAFSNWLSAAFSEFKAKNGKSRLLDSISELSQAGALLLTTNYDSLLTDATGLPPVTWEEPSQFLQVINRQRTGILHIHGHWQRPSSVVLGRSSYNRIVEDRLIQEAFQSLWMEWAWLYVGCGNGLDDPNLGRLLEWGKKWKDGALHHYFLAKDDKALALARRPDKPCNLVSIGFRDYRNLPDILHCLAPATRCSPFVPIDAEFSLLRSPGSSAVSVPFPSWQEYLNGVVPALAADVEVRDRIQEHGWAFILDVASVGKTTLAVRLATSAEQRDHPAFYLDLAKVGVDDTTTDPSAAVRRLSRPNTLLIIDNAHHQPELARHLWEEWRSRPRGSRLVLIATRTQRSLVTAAAQDLVYFEQHADNPAVELRPTVDDLWHIAEHIFRRVSKSHTTSLPVPSPSALDNWHRDYGSAIGAFCVAVLGHLADFRRGNWELPPEAASEWVRVAWLNVLDAANRENVFCLSVFGAQELEISVSNEALPCPGRTDQLLRLGLVERKELGEFGQYHRFSLREPSWGGLILAAHESRDDEEEILFRAAAREPRTALALSSRLQRAGMHERNEKLWAYVGSRSADFVKLIHAIPLSYVSNVVRYAAASRQRPLADSAWKAMEREPAELVVRAWETPLGDLADFLNVAKEHKRDTAPLWEAIERDSAKFAARVLDTPLGGLASFLDVAKEHKRDTAPLWEAIERESAKLAARALETPLGGLASFLNVAKEQGRDTAPLWEAIEREPAKLVARAWETPLHFVASFLNVAKEQGRDTAPLWGAIEREPARLAAAADHASAAQLAAFCRAVSDEQAKIVLALVQPTHWERVAVSEPLVGAIALARRCAEVSRHDLKSGIITTLLRRARRRDFGARWSSLADVAWLLYNVPPDAVGLVTRFLDEICAWKWLDTHFTSSACGSLATGLRMLTFHQTSRICRYFSHPSLGIRLRSELSRFSEASEQEQCGIIQLLGCAALFGIPAGRQLPASVSVEAVSRLPVDTLPHGVDASKVEELQFQLWVGLRAVTEATGMPLLVPSDIIGQTLDLWRNNLEESSLTPDSIEHRLNQEMVTWLQSL